MTSTIRALLLALLIGVTAVAAVAHAQPSPGGRPGLDVEARLAEITTRMSLDAAQAAQARVILSEAQQDLARAQAAATDAPVPPDVRRAIMWRVEDRLWAILTCTQKDAFRLFLRERMTSHQDHHGPGGRHHRGRGPR